MTISVMGIDPGLTGALCLIGDNESITWEMPVYEIVKNGGKRKKIDATALINILMDAKPDHIYLELVSAQGNNGSAHAFSYGFGCGTIETAIIACKIPFTYVTPQVWKKSMSCPKDKNAARQRATQLLPHLAHNWSLKRQDGVAEAALIAAYGRQKQK